MLLLQRKRQNNHEKLDSIVRRAVEEKLDIRFYLESLGRLQSGQYGENRLDREWKQLELPFPHFLLHNFEFKDEHNSPHQIDTIFLCQHFLLLIEIKNITGSIQYTEKHYQFTRIKEDGTVEILTDPFAQISRHERSLKQLMLKHRLNLPIESAIVITKPSTRISSVPTNIPIFHQAGLQMFMHGLMKKHGQALLPLRELEHFSKTLLAMHSPREWHPKLDLSLLRRGVLCEACGYRSIMQYRTGQWHCTACQSKSKTAGQLAFHDYRVLYGKTITNREFRSFFLIDNPRIAQYILNTSNLHKAGSNRGTYYIIPEDIAENLLK